MAEIDDAGAVLEDGLGAEAEEGGGTGRVSFGGRADGVADALTAAEPFEFGIGSPDGLAGGAVGVDVKGIVGIVGKVRAAGGICVVRNWRIGNWIDI